MYLLLFLVKLLFIQQKLAFRQFLLWNAPLGGAAGALPLVALGAPPMAASGNARIASLLGGAAQVVSFGLCSAFFLL